MIFKIDFKLLSLLILGFVLATVVGTVSHEYGHFFIARYYGLEARVHYGFTSWQRPEGLPQLNRFDHFLINLGGPVQTMVIGSCGLFLMYWNRKSFLKNIPLSFIQWIMVYVSLFWLRFPFNFLYSVPRWIQKRKYTGILDVSQHISPTLKKTDMKSIFTIIFAFIFLQSFAQEYGQDGYQEKRYKEAVEDLKNNEFENAVMGFYFVNRYRKNDLSVIALKKSDSILPLAQHNIRKNIIGKWILSESGSNWGFEKAKDSVVKKLLIIEFDKFSFYDLNIKTNEMTLTKSEKSLFTKNRDMRGLSFDFVFADKTLWSFYYNDKTKTLRQIMTGEDSENGRSEMVCGNSEFIYTKLE